MYRPCPEQPQHYLMTERTSKQQDILAVFNQHVQAELNGDLDTTMATMTDDPHLYNMPNHMGGEGRDAVREFYKNHLVGKFWPPDVIMETISQTVDDRQLVEELRVSFTHTTPIEWMLPGIATTGRKVVAAFVVIVGVKKGKVAYEHIYWDQASVLAQLGLINPAGLPVADATSALRLKPL